MQRTSLPPLAAVTRVHSAVGAVLLTLGCVVKSERVDMIRAVQDLRPCTRPFDSAKLARIALDTVKATYGVGGPGFESTVIRYEPDTAAGSVRIVTMPRPEENVIDAMAVVRMDCDGRIVELVLTDSA